jgi:hypothetical protein
MSSWLTQQRITNSGVVLNVAAQCPQAGSEAARSYPYYEAHQRGRSPCQCGQLPCKQVVTAT